MVDGAMERPFITLLNREETLIPCMWILQVVNAQDVHNHPIDDIFLVVYLGVERSVFSELGVQHSRET